MSEDLVLAIGQKQDKIREMIAELEDQIEEFKNQDQAIYIDDLEDMRNGVYDIENDLEKILRTLQNIENEEG